MRDRIPHIAEIAKVYTMDENTANQPPSGLTPEEQAVADALVIAWNAFQSLQRGNPAITLEEYNTFLRNIHECQRILAYRVTQRQYPDYWR